MMSLTSLCNNVQRGLLVALVVAGLMSSVGCSWFKKGDKGGEGTEVTQPVQVEEAVPANDEGDGNRPGELLPFPEMQVIYFDYDKSNIRKDQLENVEANLQYLLAHPEAKVYIEGHCDERGTIEYNFSLGLRRSEAVRQYYIDNGVAEDRIATASKGEEEPAVLGHDESAWSKNRRCEFKRMN